MNQPLLATATAFGLSASAGLNTTIPLLFVGLLAAMGEISLRHPYDVLASPKVLVALGVLAGIEIIHDKVPGADHLLHVVQLPLAATAGAILFASQHSVISSTSPDLAIIMGLLTAGGVHAARSVLRPAVTLTTLGVGNPVVSTTEDVGAFVLTGSSVFLPWLGFSLALLLVLSLLLATRRLVRWRRARALVKPVSEGD